VTCRVCFEVFARVAPVVLIHVRAFALVLVLVLQSFSFLSRSSSSSLSGRAAGSSDVGNNLAEDENVYGESEVVGIGRVMSSLFR